VKVKRDTYLSTPVSVAGTIPEGKAPPKDALHFGDDSQILKGLQLNN